jgi:hypothetical protein
MDGMEVVAEMRKLRRDIKVITMTAAAKRRGAAFCNKLHVPSWHGFWIVVTITLMASRLKIDAASISLKNGISINKGSKNHNRFLHTVQPGLRRRSAFQLGGHLVRAWKKVTRGWPSAEPIFALHPIR